MDKKFCFNRLKEYINDYEENLNGREFLILAKNNQSIFPVRLVFEGSDFVRLAGVKSDLSKQGFYNCFLNNRLSFNSWECIYCDSIMIKKFRALEILKGFYKKPVYISRYKNGTLVLLTEDFINNRGFYLSLEKLKEMEGTWKPYMLMEEGLNKYRSFNYMTALAVLCKEKGAEVFDRVTYKDKDINVKKLYFSEKIKEIITADAYEHIMKK